MNQVRSYRIQIRSIRRLLLLIDNRVELDELTLLSSSCSVGRRSPNWKQAKAAGYALPRPRMASVPKQDIVPK